VAAPPELLGSSPVADTNRGAALAVQSSPRRPVGSRAGKARVNFVGVNPLRRELDRRPGANRIISPPRHVMGHRNGSHRALRRSFPDRLTGWLVMMV